ncbi:MAG: TIGR01777 family oxidoreductase [Verrucomicrobiales bacterium]|jgi:uncharacterized protein (TIGR01777 family)|nr:TIGR01777 family oxidoreductase [Verrucomicrobiales bacterium]
MKVGITGASGSIGSALIAEGLQRGWSIVAYSRDSTQTIRGADEIRSVADLDSIDLSGLDALIHLAGESIVGFWTQEKKRRIRASRIDLTASLARTIEALPRGQRPRVFLSASAIGYYGDRGGEWLDEESDVGFGFLASVCRDWESASAKAEELGVRIVNPRIGIVLGREGFLKPIRRVFRLGLGGRLGKGNQWMSWIHLQDLVRILAECVENDSIHGRVNCVAPSPVTNREFTRCYARILGRKALLPVPNFLLKRLPGGIGSLFLHSQRVEPVMMKAFGFEWEFSDLASALTNVETGL